MVVSPIRVVLLLVALLFRHGTCLSIPKEPLGSDATSAAASKLPNHQRSAATAAAHPSSQTSTRLAILAYNDHFCCINKPASMSVYRHKNTRRGEKVVVSTLKRQLSRKVLPIHRLDHRTSGALILAFNNTRMLQHKQKDTAIVTTTPGMIHESLRRANKTYLALVRGDWDERFPTQSTITVDRPLLRRKNNDTTLQSARTRFTRIASYTTNEDYSCTLLAVQPMQSGRTHQIRRHAARDLAMPILGDTQHGDARLNRWWRTRYRTKNRLWLHCWKIEGRLVGQDTTTTIVAPLPPEFSRVLQSMKDGESRSLFEKATGVDPSLGKAWVDLRSGTLGVQKDWQKLELTRETNATCSTNNEGCL